jgi:hypothetical protein
MFQTVFSTENCSGIRGYYLFYAGVRGISRAITGAILLFSGR